jgi:ATP-dependent Clp protease ATP-binding subunit ClpB
MGVVQAHFRPEFINRLDEIVVFHPLGKAQIREDRAHPDCAAWASAWPNAASAGDDDKALRLLGNIGFDPVYGARPLKRAIQQQLGKSAGAKC